MLLIFVLFAGMLGRVSFHSLASQLGAANPLHCAVSLLECDSVHNLAEETQ